MQIATLRSSVGKPHHSCPVEEGSNPEGDRDPPNVPNIPFLCERERERGWGAQCKRRGLTGTVGGWWVRAEQGEWEAMAAKSRTAEWSNNGTPLRPRSTGATRRHVTASPGA